MTQPGREEEERTTTYSCLSRPTVVGFRKALKLTVYSLIMFLMVMLLSLENIGKILILLHNNSNNNMTVAEGIVHTLTKIAEQTLPRESHVIQ